MMNFFLKAEYYIVVVVHIKGGIKILQSRSYIHVATRGVPFTRAHLYTNVLFFLY